MLLRHKRVRNIQECPTSICQISIPTRKINLINSSLFFYSRALCQLVLSTLYGSNLQPSLIKIYNYGILVKTRTLSGLSMLEKKCACCIQAGIIAAIRLLMLCQTSPVYFHVTKLLMQVLEVACFQDFLIGMDYLLLWFWISQRIYWCSATNTSSRKRFQMSMRLISRVVVIAVEMLLVWLWLVSEVAWFSF